MTITTLDELINAMGNNSSRIIIDKASIANTAAAQTFSLWRATGQPGQGAIPTTAAVCTNSLVGCLLFTQQTFPATSYLGLFEGLSTAAGQTIELHDRLMHMGGLSGTSIVLQAVDVDLDLNLATSNLEARKGDANYSDVQWWLEWYTDTGATASNATINVTYNDTTSGNLTLVAVGGSVRASRVIALNNSIPAADSGKYIMRVNSVTLSGSTAFTGNFGVTATRYRASLFLPAVNGRFSATWSDLGLPELYNSSCIFPLYTVVGTTTGTVRCTGKVIHG